MSHLHRVLLLFPLLLLCTSSLPAQTLSTRTDKQAVLINSHQTAHELRDMCRAYIASIDGPPTPERPVTWGVCLGYIQGAVDGFAITMADYHIPDRACTPEKATTEELIRVTLKYIDGHPESLSDGAADVVWDAMRDYYPCRAK